MKKIYTLFILTAFSLIYHSQTPPNWLLNFGAINNTSVTIRNTLIDSNDNIYVNGYFSPYSNFYDNTTSNAIFASGSGGNQYVAKYSPTGNLLWVKTFQVGLSTITLDNNEDIIVTGSFIGTATFSDNTIFTASLANEPQLYILKLNKTNGGFVWKNTLSNAFSDYKPCISTCLTTLSDNSIIVGAQYIGNAPSKRLNLIKFDQDGSLISFNPFNDLNNHGYDFQGIKSDNNDNIYVVGSFYESLNMNLKNGQHIITDPSNNNSLTAFIAKYDNQFNLSWAKSVGANGADQALALEVDKTTGKSFVSIAISGNCDLNNGSSPSSITNIYQYNTSGVLAIYNSAGQLEYSHLYTGSGFNVGSAFIYNMYLKNNKLVLSGNINQFPDMNIGNNTLFPPVASSSLNKFVTVFTIYNNSFDLSTNIFFREDSNGTYSGNNHKGLITGDNQHIIYSGDGSSLKPYLGTELLPFPKSSSFIMSFDSQILKTVESQSNFNQIKIAENPIKDNLKIITNELITEITLYSSEGKLIKSFSTKEINTSNLPVGVYNLKIKTQNTIHYKKIIKK